MLFIVFAMELTAATLAFIMHGEVEMMLTRTMDETFMLYKEKDYIASSIDFLQSNVSRIVQWLNSGKAKQKKWKSKKKLGPSGEIFAMKLN